MEGKKDNTTDRQKAPGQAKAPRATRKEAEERRYAQAVQLYATTGMLMKEVAELSGVRLSGLASHISRRHRDVVMNRYGLEPGSPGTGRLKARRQTGQTEESHLKYKEAIEACSDIAYIEFNVNQIGHFFGVNSTALGSQLKTYYPGILPWREGLRKQLGIALRGPRPGMANTYAEALDLYRASDMTLPEAARSCNVSRGGFSRFMRCYHKDLIESKESVVPRRRTRRKTDRVAAMPMAQ